MPYADPEKQRAAQAESYRRRYQSDPRFAKAEAIRKSIWQMSPEGRESSRVSALRWWRKENPPMRPRVGLPVDISDLTIARMVENMERMEERIRELEAKLAEKAA